MTVSQALGSQPWVPEDARTAGEMSSQLLGRPSKHHSGLTPAASSSSPTKAEGPQQVRVPVASAATASGTGMILRTVEVAP